MDPILAGVISNGCYDLLKGLLKGQPSLNVEFEKEYNAVMKEVLKKYPKSKRTIERIFKSNIIKKELRALSGGKTHIIDSVCLKSQKILKTRDKDLPIDKIIKSFYSKFISRLRNNPTLHGLLMERYHEEILRYTLAIGKDTQDIKKGVLKLLDENASIKILKGHNFPQHLGGIQFYLIGNQDLKMLVNKIEIYDEVIGTQEIENNNYVITFDPDKQSNAIKLEYRGYTCKIIYPPPNKLDIWFINKQKNNIPHIEVTIFCCDENIIKRVIDCIKNSVDKNVQIKDVTFDEKILDILNDFRKRASMIKYDPNIKGEISIDGVNQKIDAKIAVISGMPGLCLLDQVKSITTRFKAGGKGKVAELFFIKIDNSAYFGIESLVTFDVYRNGKISSFFEKRTFTERELQDSIYKFLVKYGRLL